MSTPMHDTPDHLMMPVDADGNGPVDENEAHAYRCWCGTECGTLQHITSTDGTIMCVDMKAHGAEEHRQDVPNVMPGFCTECAGYAAGLMRLLSKSMDEDQS